MAKRSHAAQRVGRDSMSINMTGDLSAQLDKFVDNIAEKAIRSGAFAAADVLYNEMKLRAPKNSGNLSDSIYTYRDVTKCTYYRHVYVIGPNKSKARHWALLEYGHWQKYQTIYVDGNFVSLTDRPLSEPKWIPPQPYIRPTYDAKISYAMDVVLRRIGEAIKGLNGGK